MLFNSFEFVLVFLPVVVAGYFFIGKRNLHASNLWLLAASFFFYGWWDWRFVPLLFASIVWNYVFGTRLSGGHYRKLLLFAAIMGNLALLGYFKYKDFFIHAVAVLTFAPDTDWDPGAAVLPLGISFWTFTQTAFLIDSYRGKTGKCSFLDYSLFVMIFPHLISGPIINHAEMIPQFNDEGRHRVNWENIARGITLFSFGLFKKVVIADSLAPIVSGIFFSPANQPMLNTWTGVLAYTLQLYFDFSGYSEMAVGLGMMLNLLVCMTLCGFWHGAGFTFIAWGMYHGILLVVNHSWRA